MALSVNVSDSSLKCTGSRDNAESGEISSVAGKNLNISFYNLIVKWFLVPVKLVVTWKDVGQGDFGRMWSSRISGSVYLGLRSLCPKSTVNVPFSAPLLGLH